MNVIVAKEFDLRGAFRFRWQEFAVAVELLNKRLIDAKPLISDVFSYRDSLKAFATANDRSKAMKVIVVWLTSEAGSKRTAIVRRSYQRGRIDSMNSCVVTQKAPGRWLMSRSSATRLINGLQGP